MSTSQLISSSSSITSITSPTWPLTTVFTPPASCSVSSMSFDLCSDLTVGSLGQLIACGPHTNDDCLPTPFNTNLATPTFSPGVCPSGYTVALAVSQPGSTVPQTSLCCPIGLTYIGSGLPSFNGAYTSVCYSSLTAARQYTAITTVVGGITQSLLSATASSGGQYENQYAYQSPLTVLWASTDLPNFHPASAPLLGASPASTSTQSTGFAKATSANTSSSSSALSTAAEAGIGVGGAALCILAVIGLVWWLLRRRKRLRARDADDSLDYSKAELPGEEAYRSLARKSAGVESSNEAYEMDGVTDALEVGAGERHELPGDFEGYEMSTRKRPIASNEP